jgi:hypothetical protein
MSLQSCKNKSLKFRGGKWSAKYKRSIDCKRPKGFSQRQHCKYGRKTRKYKGGTMWGCYIRGGNTALKNARRNILTSLLHSSAIGTPVFEKVRSDLILGSECDSEFKELIADMKHVASSETTERKKYIKFLNNVEHLNDDKVLFLNIEIDNIKAKIENLLNTPELREKIETIDAEKIKKKPKGKPDFKVRPGTPDTDTSSDSDTPRSNISRSSVLDNLPQHSLLLKPTRGPSVASRGSRVASRGSRK